MDTNTQDNFVVVTDDSGKTFKAEVLDIFQVAGYDDNNYVVYTFGEKVDDNNERLYISKIVELDNGEGFNFAGIEDSNEWNAVQAAFNESLELIGSAKK